MFFHVKYKLHQLSNSVFVNQDWTKRLVKLKEGVTVRADFRSTGLYAFQGLRMFCELINSTISNDLIEFYSRQYVSASLIPSKLFEPEAKSLIGRFQSSLTNSFLSSLSIVREAIQANALLSRLKTNYKIHKTYKYHHIQTFANTYKNCSYAALPTFTEQSVLFHYSTSNSSLLLPSFYIGCSLIEALLQSTLECFYQQQCIDKLPFYFSWFATINITTLNSSLPSLYSVNSTIQQLIDQPMIEQWNATPVYESYYNECEPIQCTYTIETRHDIDYIVTTLFGIVGGLITVLEFIVPKSVKFIASCLEKRKKTVVPQISTILM